MPASQDENAWLALGDEGQAQALKTVIRLCLMKSASKEVLLRTAISKALKEHSRGVEYAKCLHSILKNAQLVLDSCFGLTLYALPDIKAGATIGGSGCGGVGTSSAGSFMVFNALRSAQVQALHAESCRPHDVAFMAFVFVVLQAIHASPGQTEEKAVAQTLLLRKLRTLDSRFPETLSGTWLCAVCCNVDCVGACVVCRVPCCGKRSVG